MSGELPDEMSEVFSRVTPRGPARELRARVLAAAERELTFMQPSGRPRWERVFELAAAASLLLGVAVTLWQQQREYQWAARVYGTSDMEGPSAALTAAIEPAIDAESARVIAGQFAVARRPIERADVFDLYYARLIRELSADKPDCKL